MKKFTLLFSIFTLVVMSGFSQVDLNSGTGLFLFNNADNLWENTATNTLTADAALAECEGVFHWDTMPDPNPVHDMSASVELEGYSVIDGADGKAIALAGHNWFRIWHGISANGGGSYVNDFTIVMDVRIAESDSIYSLFECNPHSTSGGKSSEMEIDTLRLSSVDKPWSTEGIAPSVKTLEVNKWYRITYVAKLSEYVRMYVNGELWNEVTGDNTDGRPAPYSNDNDPDDAVFKVAGNNETHIYNTPARDEDKDVDMVAIFAQALTDADVLEFGAPSIVSIKSNTSSQNRVKLYPNPASDLFTIEGTGNYEIMNSIGQVVIQGTVIDSKVVNINHLNNGVYFVKLSDNAGIVSTQKLLIK